VDLLLLQGFSGEEGAAVGAENVGAASMKQQRWWSLLWQQQARNHLKCLNKALLATIKVLGAYPSRHLTPKHGEC
jgi:hypothetical protein